MSHNDLLTLQRLGERLISSYSRLIETLPEDARGISGMSRYLGVHKATCQRIVEGTSHSADAIEALARFPGLKGFEQHLAACTEHKLDPAALQACAAAIAQLKGELESRELSHRGFIDYIASLRDDLDGAAASLQDRRATEQRRTLYSAARGLTGEDLEAKVAIGIIMPSRSRPDHLSVFIVSALLGVERESFARPIAPFVLSGWWDHFQTIKQGDRPIPSHTHDAPSNALLEEFSTAGLRATKLSGGAARTLLVVDTDSVTGDGPIDVAVLFRTDAPENPLTTPGARITAAARIVQPTQFLISDIYLHHSLAQATPRVACMALTAPPGDSPGGGLDECWYDRFPDTPKLAPLSTQHGIAPRATRPERLAARITDYLFTLVAASGTPVERSAFVAHRCMVKYPIWQSEYRAYF